MKMHLLRFILSTFFSLVFCLPVAAQNESGTRERGNDRHKQVWIGVLPFSPLGISIDEAEMAAIAIRNKIAEKSAAIKHGDIMQILTKAGCNEKDKWNTSSCVLETGERAGADYILAGSMGKVGSSIIIEITIYDVKKKKAIQIKEYQVKGSFEDLISSAPSIIASDLPQECITVSKTAETVIEEYIRDTTTTKPVEASEEEPEETTEKPVIQRITDTSTVKGFSMGVSTLFALGTTTGPQSPVSFRLHFLFPTTQRSHLRFRVGFPLWDTEHNPNASDRKVPDPYFNVEHEWGLKPVGLTAGLVYMPFLPYEQSFRYRYSGLNNILNGKKEYDTYHAFNIVFGIRAGNIKKGAFFGRIAFPPAILMDPDADKQQRFIEFSAFGGFVVRKVKVGFGTTGMIKIRDYDRLVDSAGNQIQATWIDEIDFSYSNIMEYYMLMPSFKVAQLFGEHLVVALCLEIGGIIIPRLNMGSRYTWRPSMGVDFTYSFGKMNTPTIMDGNF